MSLEQATGAVSDLGVRFNVVGVLPTAMLTTALAALIASGAPGESPDFDELIDSLDKLSAADAVVLTAVVVVVGLLLQPLQLALVRVLEGYWGSGRVARWIANRATRRH